MHGAPWMSQPQGRGHQLTNKMADVGDQSQNVEEAGGMVIIDDGDVENIGFPTRPARRQECLA